MSGLKKCPHCNAVIDTLEYKCTETQRIFGRCSVDFDDHESRDSDYIDSCDYVYNCPECDEEVEDGDLIDVDDAGVAQDFIAWCHGMRVRCRIQSHHNVECIVTIEDEEVFLCQNVIQGKNCEDQQGKEYSWSVECGTESACTNNEVSDIVVLDDNGLPPASSNPFNNPQPSTWVV